MMKFKTKSELMAHLDWMDKNMIWNCTFLAVDAEIFRPKKPKRKKK